MSSRRKPVFTIEAESTADGNVDMEGFALALKARLDHARIPDQSLAQEARSRSGKLIRSLTGSEVDPPEVMRWVLDHGAEPALGIAALKVWKDILVEWIKARVGRKVTITVGKQKIQVTGSNNIHEAVAALQGLPGLFNAVVLPSLSPPCNT